MTNVKKQFDLEERTAVFGENVIKFTNILQFFKEMKKTIFLVFFLVCLGFLSISVNETQAGGPTLIDDYQINIPATWTKEKSPYIIKNTLTIKAPLTIEPGVVIKMNLGKNFIVLNTLTARGTETEKIVFTSQRDDNFGGDTNNDGSATNPSVNGDWSGIRLHSSSVGKMILENAAVYYGSRKNEVSGAITISSNNAIIRNCEIKHAMYTAIYIYEASPVIENNLITQNNIGIIFSTRDTRKTAVIKNNSIFENIAGAMATPSNPTFLLDARDNWWGDESGPYYVKTGYYSVEKDNLDGKGNKVGDNILFRPWLGKNPFAEEERRPIILIPGIGASVNLDTMIGGLFNNNWQLFSHTYDGIIEAFKSMGYKENKDFFIAYYDWRNRNDDSAQKYLKPIIKKANQLNGTSKVNIVAHSMGGLVARSYIQSDDYGNDVENLFLIGTPNRGSSDVYPVWEGGYIPKNWETKFILRIYLAYLTKKYPTSNNYETIRQYIPSIKQLMPVYDYIYPKGKMENLKNYSSMNEVNTWLENLNAGIEILNDRVKVSVIAGDKQATINGIPVIESDEHPLWKDGKPDPLDPEKNDSSGDGRVLLSSSKIPSLYEKIIDFNHGDIVSRAEEFIAEKINENLDRIYDAPHIQNELGFWLASPVDIEIRDPEGRIISGNANEIPLAKYASESKPDGVKIVSIPNPAAGGYILKITGNGNGTYRAGLEYMDYKNKHPDKSFVAAGIISKDEERIFTIKYDPENSENIIGTMKIDINGIINDVKNAQAQSLTDSREAKFILTKLKALKILIERIDKKEDNGRVAENFKEQVNRQIDWLIDYIREKEEKNGKGSIKEPAKSILTENLESIRY